MRVNWAFGPAIAALLLSTSCSNQPAPGNQSSSSTASATSPGHTSRTSAGTQFLALANSITQRYQTVPRDITARRSGPAPLTAPDLVALRADYAEEAAAYSDARAGLDAIRFPVEVTPDVQTLEDALDSLISQLEVAAQAPDLSEFEHETGPPLTKWTLAVYQADKQLRIDLDLPDFVVGQFL